MDSLIYVVAAIVFIIGVTVGIKYLREKKVISDGDIGVIINSINIAKNIINDLGLNGKTEKAINDVLDAADAVAEYVFNLGQVTDVSDKKSLAESVVNEILSILRVPVADKDKNLIDIVLSESLKFLEGKNQA